MTENGSFIFYFCIWKACKNYCRCCFPLRPLPIGKYKQYSAKNAQSAAEGICKSSRVEDFFAKNGKGIASFVCFLYNKGKIN